ncbi:MAG: gamma-glutamyl-gamma-aminobutyrate hydrolase family protein [Halieaceae bacterium]|nr:gamma-glutamyl-gamma-aminobutyrate hydrolase family protein [Halieaceae bacterium]
MKSIAILKTDSVRPEWVERFGEYPDMFQAVLKRANPDLQFTVYDVQLGEYPKTKDQHGAYLVTGSKAGVYEDHDWLPPLEDFVRDLVQAEIPLIGICFGHQLIAHALGGQVNKSDKGWGVGVHRHVWRFQPEWLITSESEFKVLVSHQDQVHKAPEDLQVLAGSDFCPIAALYKPGAVLTFQGHPEFVPEYSKTLMVSREDRIGDEALPKALASLDQGHDGDALAEIILAFLRETKSPLTGIGH